MYYSYKNTYFCDNLYKLIKLNSNTSVKFKYQKLKHSNTYLNLNYLLTNKKSYLACEIILKQSKDFILTLSKFVDYKINFNKNKYRSKTNETIIENLCRILAFNIHKDFPYILFNEYKKHYNTLQIKIKENKMFKFLLAKYLLDEMIKIESEVIYISNIIHKYKKRKFNYNYNKNIYNYAKYYAIFKYNNNSKYYEYRYNLNKKEIINSLISYLFEAENKLKTIIIYLKTMF